MIVDKARMSPARRRDEFKSSIINALAKRASYICSNPDCRALTIGPSAADQEKFESIGKAAHITAAAPGGARYDPSLNSSERTLIENGIFLCSGCADKIDKNLGIDYPADLLRRWKKDHEDWVKRNLNKSVYSLTRQRMPALNLTFDGGTSILNVGKRTASRKYDKHRGQLSNRIVRVDFQLANSGDGPATDIDVVLKFESSVQIVSERELRQMWDTADLDLFGDPEAFVNHLFRKKNMSAIQRIGREFSDQISFGIFEGLISSRRELSGNSVAQISKARISQTEAMFRITKLKHNLNQGLESLYVIYPSWESMCSFGIVYRINADEVVGDVYGRLEVLIKKRKT